MVSWYITLITCVIIEGTFTIFQIITWLSDFHTGMNPFGNGTAWPVLAEVTRYIKKIAQYFFFVICQAIEIQITARPKLRISV